VEAVGAFGRFDVEQLRSALDLFRFGASPGALEALHRMNNAGPQAIHAARSRRRCASFREHDLLVAVRGRGQASAAAAQAS
jgi:hypothetical protein